MADDYLGKRMEEHERMRGRMPMTRSTRPSTARATFPPLRVLVDNGLCPAGRRAVETLRGAGCRVAFCGGDPRAGAALAQSTGARFYPGFTADEALADLRGRWGGVDLALNIADAAIDPDLPITALLKQL